MQSDFLTELAALMEKHGATLHVGSEMFWANDRDRHKNSGILTIEVNGKVVGRSIATTLTPVDVAVLKPEPDLSRL